MRRLPVISCTALIASWIFISAAAAQVLRVGTYKGIPGQYPTIQAAVGAARPNDWILVAPGDYKTTTSYTAPGTARYPAAVLITTPSLTLRGMNRSAVVLDGTKPGSPLCSSAPADQNYGPATPKGPGGLNGVMVWKADNVSVENMTACNFIAGTGGSTGTNGALSGDDITGNEFWWNGGIGTGAIGGYGFTGSYLTATSTFYNGSTALTRAASAEYGLFSSNWSGGTFDQDYGSNFNDSGFYIGACQQVCNQTVDHAWAEYNVLGYSGSNSGGNMVIEHSQFDNNQDGFDTNSQNGDQPPPQDGTCPGNGISPITHTHSCWVFTGNYVHDNNNPNVPMAGRTAGAPVGIGLSIAGGRNDTVMNNAFVNNGAWGTIVLPYPDSGGPCTGGSPNNMLFGPGSCLFDDFGNALIGNTYTNDGFFGNPTNGPFDQVNLNPAEPTDCYSANAVPGSSLSGDAAALQAAHPTCDGSSVSANANQTLLAEALCDGQISVSAGAPPPCQPADQYPRLTATVMHPLPANLPTMPNPCAGVAPNPWCGGQVSTITACVARARVRVPLAVSALESFVSVTVKVGSARPVTHKAHGRATKVTIALGGRAGRRVRVSFVERITVGGHREVIRFTRLYHRCG